MILEYWLQLKQEARPERAAEYFAFALCVVVSTLIIGRTAIGYAAGITLGTLAAVLCASGFSTRTTDESWSRWWTTLIRRHLIFFYFFAFVPTQAAHQNPDLWLIALLFAMLLHSAPQGGRILPALRGNGAHLLMLFFIGAVSLWPRLTNLDYNGPFIDELLNFEVSTIGNAFFLASDSRLWALICRIANEYGGLTAARAVNASICVLAVLLVYWLYVLFTDFVGYQRRTLLGPILAAAIFSFSAPVLFSSTLATHDMLALACFIAGFCFLIRGIEPYRPALLIGAALLFFFSFAARYFILVSFPAVLLLLHGPVSLLSEDQRKRLSWFYFSGAVFFLTYFLFDIVHIFSSVKLGAWLSSGIAELRYSLVTSALVVFILPLLLLGLLAAIFRTPECYGASAAERRAQLYLLTSALILPLVQLIKCSDFGSEKNLSYSILFAAPLLAMQLETIIVRRSTRPIRFIGEGALFIALFIGLTWSITATLLPIATRKEHSRELKPIMQALADRPLRSTFTATLNLMQNRWLDPKGVHETLVAEGLDKQRVAVFGRYGGEHISWHLTHSMGRDPKTNQYYVDQGAPWRKKFFKYAHKRKVPVIIAILPEADIPLQSRLEKFPEYQLHSISQFIHPGSPYGRAYIFINPQWLDSAMIHGEFKSYLLARHALATRIPEQIKALRATELQRELSAMFTTRSALTDSNRAASLEFELASVYIDIGEAEKAKQLFQSIAKRIARKEVADVFLSYIGRKIADVRVYRQKGVPGYHSNAENLLARATLHTPNPEDQEPQQYRAYWLDFNPPLEIPLGAALRLETSLLDSTVQAVRIVEEAQDFEKMGDMIVFPFSLGFQQMLIFSSHERRVKRIDVQVGPEAWGPLGGTTTAVVEFHGVFIENTTPWHVFAPDPLKPQ